MSAATNFPGFTGPDELLDHRDWIYRMALALLRDADSAEDLTHQTFTRALENPPRHGSNIKGWLRRILQNQLARNFRTTARQQKRELEAYRRQMERVSAATPDELVAKAEADSKITEALLELEEPYRTVLLLHYYQNARIADIARQLERPVSTVKSQLDRGKTRLRQGLKKRGYDYRVLSLAILCIPIDKAYAGTAFASSSASATTGRTLWGQKTSTWAAGFVIVLAGAGGYLLWKDLPEFLTGTDTNLRSRVEPAENRTDSVQEVPYAFENDSRSTAEPLEEKIEFAPDDMEEKERTEAAERKYPVKLLDLTGTPLEKEFGAGGEFGKYATLMVVATQDPPSQSGFALGNQANHYFWGIGEFQPRKFRPDLKMPEDIDGILKVKRTQSPFYVSVVMGSTVVHSEEVSDHRDSITLRIPKSKVKSVLSTLTFRVRDALSLQPIATSLEVTLGPVETLWKEVHQGENGVVRFENIPAGHFSLIIQELNGPDKFERWQGFVTVRPGEENELVDIDLSPPRTISGVVTDEDDKPVAGQRLLAWSLDRDQHPIWLQSRFVNTRSDESGAFTLNGIGPGEQLIFTLGGPGGNNEDWGIQDFPVTDLSRTVSDVRIRVRRGRDTALQLLGESDSADIYYFALYRFDQQAYPIKSFYFTNPVARLPLVDGSYSAKIYRGESLLYQKNFEVRPVSAGFNLAR